MILDKISTPVKTSGGSMAAGFSIACNGKAFRVLSDTLYKNKIGSIVRELSCNAYDAHVVVGKKDVPFSIHLPDAFEPWFSVQDSGPGLSPEDIKTVFTVYFQSTKDQSNDSIGAFGLGAKTPFSYTDQFTVTSVYAGQKSIYGMYITESGIPDYKLMMQTPTDEPSGVEIKMSVKQSDYYTFRKEVENQLKYFTVKPNCNVTILWPVVDFFIDTPAYQLPKNAGYQSGMYIIQGNVGYPVDVENLASISSVAKGVLNRFRYYGLRMIFPIGQIGVTASREGVEYTKETIKNIEQMLLKIDTELAEYAKQQLKSEPSDWARAARLNSDQLLSALSGANAVPSAEKAGMHFHFRWSKFSVVLDSKGITHGSNLLRYNRSSRVKSFKVDIRHTFVQPNEVGAIVVKDTSNRTAMRIEQLNSTVRGAQIYVLELSDVSKADEAVKIISENMGGCPCVMKMSDIALPVSVATRAVRSSIPTHYTQKVSGCTKVSDWNKEFDALEEIEDDVIYVEVENRVLSNYQDEQRIYSLRDLRRFDSTIPNLIGLRKATLKKIEGKTNFIKLEDYLQKLKNKLQSCPEQAKLVRKEAKARAVQQLSLSAFNFLKNANADIGKFCRNLGKNQTSTASSKAVAIHTALGLDIPEVSVKRYKEIEEKFLQKYPLLRMVNKFENKTHEPLLDYINAMYNTNSPTTKE